MIKEEKEEKLEIIEVHFREILMIKNTRIIMIWNIHTQVDNIYKCLFEKKKEIFIDLERDYNNIHKNI